MTSCRYLSIDVDPDGAGDLSELAIELRRLRRLQNELSLAQRWVQGRLTDVMERIGDHIDDDSRIVVEVMASLADHPDSVEAISRDVEVPPSVVEDVLETLESRGVVEHSDDQWQLDG